MQELRWIDHLPNQTLEGGLSLLEELMWNITVRQTDHGWFVNGGHKTLLKTSSRESVDAFLYGMALAYSVMPDSILDRLKAQAKADTKGERES